MDSMDPTDAFIAIRHLLKHYTEGDLRRTIFADLTLDIPRGQFVALLGQSGSGKSTLLKIAAGLIDPDWLLGRLQATVAAPSGAPSI